jgi:hypothetical protein
VLGGGLGCHSRSPLASELLHLFHSRLLDVQRTHEVVQLRLNPSPFVLLLPHEAFLGLGAGVRRDEGAHRLGLVESHWVALDVLGVIVSPVRMHVVGVKIGAVDESSVDRLGVAPTVIFEGRLSEVSGEGTIRYPPGGLFKLGYAMLTFSISFSCSFSVNSLTSPPDLPRA